MMPRGVQPAEKVAALLDALEARRGLSDRDANDDPIVLIRDGLMSRQEQGATSPLTGLVQRLDSQPGLEEQLNSAFKTRRREDLIAAIGRMPPEEATRRIDDISIQLVIQSDSANNDGGASSLSQAEVAAFNIEAFIQAEGFTCHRIRDDGHCMFASIAHAAGGELSDAVDSNSQEAAMAIRQWAMGKLVDLEPNRIANFAGSLDARRAKLGEAYLELARGFNVARPDQDGWGTSYSLPIAAALFDRPIVVIDQNGIGNLYRPDCSEEPLNGSQPLPRGGFADLVQRLRDEGANPIAIYKSSPTHFQSVNLEP
jgi:hypothetical protein